MANEPTTAIQKATTEIERVLSECNAMTLREMPALSQAVTLATGINTLRKAMSDDLMRQVFMPLQGSALGFITDKDRDGGYPVSVVRDCMIEAMIHGLRPVGNEINIIAGRFYAAQNGFARIVAEYPGLTDLVLTPGVPVFVGDKGALVPYRATWQLQGKRQEIVCDVVKRADGSASDTRIAVRVNAGMGSDAVIGKAKRKLLKRVYETITGSKLNMTDGEVIDTVGEVQSEPAPAPAAPEQDGKRIKLGKNGTKAAASETNPPADETTSGAEATAAKYAKPKSSPKHDPATGEVAPEDEPPMREPGDDTDEIAQRGR